jgi:hypothetical protein
MALPRAAWPSNTSNYPTASQIAPLVSRVWLDHHDGMWAEDRINPTDHMAPYGQYQRAMISAAAALACLNPDATSAASRSSTAPTSTAFKEMIYGLLQAGIDTWGLTQDLTHTWEGGGGKGGGRKFAVVFAGKMFGSNAYSGLASGLPSMATGPWTVQRLINVPQNGTPTAVPRFAEDSQMYEANSGALTTGNRGDWDWQGSPWMWGANYGDRGRQHDAPDSGQWSYGQHEGESKRFQSSSAYVGMTIAVRMFGLEGAWANPAFLGYMDRWMIPVHAGVVTAYQSASSSTGLYGGITTPYTASRFAHDLNPQNVGLNPPFTMDIWNLHRWQPDLTGTGPVAIRPNGFTWDTNVPAGTGSACTGIRAPTMLTQFDAVAGTTILVEAYCSETFTGTSPVWLTFFIGGLYSSSGVTLTYTGALNSDTVYVDPSTAWSSYLLPTTFGYQAQRIDLTSSLIGIDVAMQGVFLEIPATQGQGGCVAASNAMILRVH